MKNLFPIILILSVLTLSNCTKQIDFDEQDIAPRIVVNSLFTNDSVWSAHISRSVGVLDNTSYTTIDDASVNIFDENANLVTTLTHQGKWLIYITHRRQPIARSKLYIRGKCKWV